MGTFVGFSSIHCQLSRNGWNCADSPVLRSILRAVEQSFECERVIIEAEIEQVLVKGPFDQDAMQFSEIRICWIRSPASARVICDPAHGQFDCGNKPLGKLYTALLSVPCDP